MVLECIAFTYSNKCVDADMVFWSVRELVSRSQVEFHSLHCPTCNLNIQVVSLCKLCTSSCNASCPARCYVTITLKGIMCVSLT